VPTSFGRTAPYSDRFAGPTERITVTISGRFTRRRVSGHLRVRTRIVRDGRQTDEGDSGPTRRSMSREGQTERVDHGTLRREHEAR